MPAQSPSDSRDELATARKTRNVERVTISSSTAAAEDSSSTVRRLVLGSAALSASAAALWLVFTASRDVMGRAEPGASQPLVVSPPSQDIVLDDVKDPKSDTPVNATFRISNRGTLPARIKSLQTSCGCALPTLSSNHIPAGAAVSVNVAIRPQVDGTQTFTIWLYFDRPTPQTLALPGSVTWGGSERLKSSPSFPAGNLDHGQGLATETRR